MKTNPIENIYTHMKNTVKNNNDCWIIITGEERTGKSVLALQLMKKFYGEIRTRNIITSGKDYIQKQLSDPKGQLYIIDEITQGLYRRDANTQENKSFMEHVIENGQFNSTTIICAPKLKVIDTYIAEHRVHYWLHVTERGKFQIHKPIKHIHGKGKIYWKRIPDTTTTFTYQKIPETEPTYQEYIKLKKINSKQKSLGIYIHTETEIKKLSQALNSVTRKMKIGEKINE